MDAQREMLKMLMGETDVVDFKDERCCPYYLCGFCPYEIFENSKLDMGYCDKVHSDSLKQQFELAAQTENLEKYYYDYESLLKKFKAECDRKIKQSHLRRHGEDEIPIAEVESNPTTMQLLHRIEEIQNQALEYAERGEIDKTIKCQEKIEELKIQKFSVQARYILEFGKSLKNTNTATAAERLRVCSVCGALLAVNDTEVRLADHFGGKIHLGYLAIYEKLRELEEMRKVKEEERRAPPPPPKEEKEKEKARSKSRSRSKSHKHSKHARSRRRSRSKSRTRRHSRSRSRDRRHGDRRDRKYRH